MIAGYVQVNLSEMLDQIGEDRVISILSDFSSGVLNRHVEELLKDT